MELSAPFLAHGAVRWGRPEVILNRRRDVPDREIPREIWPFEAKDFTNVAP